MTKDEYRTFRVNQSAIIRNEEGRILLLRQGKYWQLPGGRINKDDTDTTHALAREILEETGMRLVTIKSALNITWSTSGETYLVIFEIVVDQTTTVTLSSEHDEFVWVAIDELHNYPFVREGISQELQKILE